MNNRMVPSLLAAVPMPLVLIAQDGRIAAMNSRAVDLLGTNGVGRNHVTVLRQPATLDCIEAALRGGRPGTARFLDNGLDREAIYRVVAAPVLGTEEFGVLVTFEDITDVERAERMRRDFVANVSHELKTPLTAVLGFVETLRGAAKDDAAARERFLTIMESEAQRMNRLVSDLLSLSRVESEERRRPTDRLDIVGLLESTALTLRSMAEGAGVALELVLPEERVPPIVGDADQLQQVLTNLVENAIKYGGTGGRVTVTLTHLPREIAFRGPAVRIDVRDYGEGFDPIHIPRLTERFYRVDTHRSRAQGGTGLGLAIAKHIVNRHRGRLRIDTEEGQGACFTILLPVG